MCLAHRHTQEVSSDTFAQMLPSKHSVGPVEVVSPDISLEHAAIFAPQIFPFFLLPLLLNLLHPY